MMSGLPGQYERGLGLIRLALDAYSDKQADPWQLPAYLSQIYLAMGSPERAEEYVHAKLADEQSDPMLKLFLTWSWNNVLIAKGEYAQAIQSATGFLPTLRDFDCRLFVPDTLLALGQA